MSELISQLGIDWRSLASQAVNFLALLILLRIFAYKPLLKILKDRRVKIEEGLGKAEEADLRLKEISIITKEKLKKADRESLEILRKTEQQAKQMEAALLKEAEQKEAEALKKTELLIQSKQEEARKLAEKETAVLVKQALVRTVELAPEKIDEALIKKAVKQITEII